MQEESVKASPIRLTPKARTVLKLAFEHAATPNAQLRDIMGGISKEGTCTAAKVLSLLRISSEQIYAEDSVGQSMGRPVRLLSLIRASYVEASKLGMRVIGPEHLLLALTNWDPNQSSLGGVDASVIRSTMMRLLGRR